MHVRGVAHAGIVYFPHERRSIGSVVADLLTLHAAGTADDMTGQLFYILQSSYMAELSTLTQTRDKFF